MTSDQSPVLPEHAEGFTPIAEGTLVNITQRSSCGDPGLDEDAARTGITYVVEGYCRGTEDGSDDPNGRAYYLLDIPDRSYGGNFWAYPEHVETVQTVEQRIAAHAEAAEALTERAMAQYIADSAMAGSRGVEFDEADWTSGNGTAVLSGTTDDGVRFTTSFRVLGVQIDL